MRRMGLLVAVALMGLPVGVAGAGHLRSGIAGRILEGPTCPVETSPPQPQCAPRPLSAEVRITPRAAHGATKTVRSDSDGRFEVRLAPGAYTVQGLPVGRSGLPRPPAPERVEVHAGRFSRVTLYYDTGIR